MISPRTRSPARAATSSAGWVPMLRPITNSGPPPRSACSASRVLQGGQRVADERGHRGPAAALAVAAELGDEEIEADLAVEAVDPVVVAHHLAVAVEVEHQRPRSVVLRTAVEAGGDVDAGRDLDLVVAGAGWRRAGVRAREEHPLRRARAVEQRVVGPGYVAVLERFAHALTPRLRRGPARAGSRSGP